MKANIHGEKTTDDKELRIGITVTDNSGVEHGIEIDPEGKIHKHGQGGYHDKAARRTHDDNERVEQARRFARYYVFQERGYDTLSPPQNPVRVEAARRALETLSTSTFESLFGDLYQQFRSDFDPNVESVRDLPDDVADPELVVYQRDLYFGIDPDNVDFGEEMRAMADQYGIDLTTPAVDTTSDAWRQFGQAAAEAATDSDDSVLSAMELTAVSGLHLVYPDTSGTEQRVTAETPLERDPDARIELPSVDIDSLERFQAFLAFHLRCQIRDLFIGMGVEPPEAFRVRGPGKYAATMRYRLLDMYDEYYHLDDQSLDSWAEA